MTCTLVFSTGCWCGVSNIPWIRRIDTLTCNFSYFYFPNQWLTRCSRVSFSVVSIFLQVWIIEGIDELQNYICSHSYHWGSYRANLRGVFRSNYLYFLFLISISNNEEVAYLKWGDGELEHLLVLKFQNMLNLCLIYQNLNFF